LQLNTRVSNYTKYAAQQASYNKSQSHYT